MFTYTSEKTMIASLNVRHLTQLSLAASSVIGGVVAKNSARELQTKNTQLADISGILLFTVGWIAVAYLGGQKGKTTSKLLTWASVAAIWYSATTMRKKADLKQKVPLHLLLMFGIGWVTFGWVSDHSKQKRLGLVAAGMVIISMMGFLPWQRAQCIVDGPGLVFYTIAWAIIVLVNSIVPETQMNLGKELISQLRQVLPF